MLIQYHDNSNSLSEVTLHDAESTFGVRKTDDQTVVVSDSTALTKVGPARWSYNATLFPNVDYQYAINGLFAYDALGAEESFLYPVYASLADVNAYLQTKLHNTVWFDLDLATRTKAIIQATFTLNTLGYRGSKANSANLLEFPRNYSSCNSSNLDFIPPEIRYATAELAFVYADDQTLEDRFESLRVTSRRFSSVGTTYGVNQMPENLYAGIISITAWQYLQPYLRDPSILHLRRV